MRILIAPNHFLGGDQTRQEVLVQYLGNLLGEDPSSLGTLGLETGSGAEREELLGYQLVVHGGVGVYFQPI